MSQFYKTSFWSLLSQNSVEKITIPIIQRAYTQGGRDGDSKIEIKGQKFLNRLIEALKGKPILLDFVYGSYAKNKIFPLDGQQRLSTLFLLHWYIAQKEEDKLNISVKGILKKFSYETRQSSRYFCEHLCDYKIDIDRADKLSETIKNKKWFMLSWLDDPSIRSMLGMLDKIDAQLKDDTYSYWDSLTRDINNCPITFFYTSLQDLNLTDDLYIKMNARGLELTDFEKLKAAFNQKIDDEKWDDTKTLTEKFAHKIDTVWIDLFWQYRGEDGLIDNELVNFIAGVAINGYAEYYTSNSRDRIEKRIAELANDTNAVSPDDFHNDSYNYLVNCLNKYAEKNNDKASSNINLWDYCKTTLFEDLILGEDITYPKRVLFYAQTEYLFKNTLDKTTFSDWMRVIRNIVKNSTIDSTSSFISAINLVKEISAGSDDIYSYLAINKIKSGHAAEQVKHEIDKAKLINDNSADNKKIIFDTEDTNFCNGDIRFPMYCIGYDSANNASFDVKKLTKLQVIIRKELDIEKVITDEFKRAFLTIIDNNYYDDWKLWSHSFQCHKRWLLNKNVDLIKFAKSTDWKRDYLKELLVKRINKSFVKIADDYAIPPDMPRWKVKLIKGIEKLDGATFILFPDNNSYCFLAKQQKPSKKGQVTKITNR